MKLNSVFRIVVVIILAVIVLIAVMLYKINSIISEDKEIKVPNLVGMDILDISNPKISPLIDINKNLDKKIRLKISSIPSNEYPQYYVVKQEPNPVGKTIKDGRTITLWLSKGIPIGQVPNYINLPFSKVHQINYNREKSLINKLKSKIKTIISNNKLKSKNKLKEINNLISKQSNIKPSLIIGNVTFVNHPYIPSGVVVDQEPKPGKLLYKDSEINFLVSLGRFKRSFKSQNYTGRFVEQVIKDLEEKNIFCNIKNVKGDNKSDGKIVYQSVKPGNDLHPGDVIELHVVNYNLGEIQKNYKIIKFIVPSIYDNKINEKSSNPSLNRVSVKLVVKDLNGETVIYEGLNNPNDKIIECYKVIGIGILKVYLDDKQYSSYKIE